MVWDTVMPGLADAINARIKREGWTQAEACVVLGIPRGALRSALSGRTPDLEHLVNIARGMGISLEEAVVLALPEGVSTGTETASDLALQVAALIDAKPEFAPIARHLLRLPIEDARGVLAYLESLERHRERDNLPGG